MYNFRTNNRGVTLRKPSSFDNSKKFSMTNKSKSATKIFSNKPRCTPVQFVRENINHIII